MVRLGVGGRVAGVGEYYFQYSAILPLVILVLVLLGTTWYYLVLLGTTWFYLVLLGIKYLIALLSQPAAQ